MQQLRPARRKLVSSCRCSKLLVPKHGVKLTPAAETYKLHRIRSGDNLMSSSSSSSIFLFSHTRAFSSAWESRRNGRRILEVRSTLQTVSVMSLRLHVASVWFFRSKNRKVLHRLLWIDDIACCLLEPPRRTVERKALKAVRSVVSSHGDTCDSNLRSVSVRRHSNARSRIPVLDCFV